MPGTWADAGAGGGGHRLEALALLHPGGQRVGAGLHGLDQLALGPGLGEDRLDLGEGRDGRRDHLLHAHGEELAVAGVLDLALAARGQGPGGLHQLLGEARDRLAGQVATVLGERAKRQHGHAGLGGGGGQAGAALVGVVIGLGERVDLLGSLVLADLGLQRRAGLSSSVTARPGTTASTLMTAMPRSPFTVATWPLGVPKAAVATLGSGIAVCGLLS